MARVFRGFTTQGMRFPPFSADLERGLRGRSDYVRLASLALALNRLEEEGISGEIAEVGVWRGDTSVVLQSAAPHRPLHLFDTFSGFPQNQLDREGVDERFRNTDASQVRRRLPVSARVHFHIGIVPQILEEASDLQFAFVLLDLDLSTPTSAALEFFYPRLVKGAYVFVHDYNSPESDEAGRRSLGSFLTGKPEMLVEIPDMWGSAVFRKL